MPTNVNQLALLVAPSPSFHHHHQHRHLPSTFNVGIGVFPLLAATSCVEPPETAGVDETEHKLGITKSGSANGGMKSGDGNGGGERYMIRCMDCGNRAKKDCGYRRCRACCKNGGFDCATHVKSTWVPAARRLERRLTTVEVAGSGDDAGGGGGSSGSSSGGGTKRPRVVTSQNATTGSRTSYANTLDLSSTHQDATFIKTLPRTVQAPAIFKCTRVTAVDNGENEVGYQAVVRIGGHVFKGFLYDQGIRE